MSSFHKFAAALHAVYLVIVVAGERIYVQRIGYSYVANLSYTFEYNNTEVWGFTDVILDTSSDKIVLLHENDTGVENGECLTRLTSLLFLKLHILILIF